MAKKRSRLGEAAQMFRAMAEVPVKPPKGKDKAKEAAAKAFVEGERLDAEVLELAKKFGGLEGLRDHCEQLIRRRPGLLPGPRQRKAKPKAQQR